MADEKIRRKIANIERNARIAAVRLRPGASDEAIARAESILATPLPADVRAFYMTHDGADGYVLDGRELLSLQRMVAEWTIWKGLLEEGALGHDDEAEPGPGAQARWWSVSWIPFTYDGAGNHFVIDMEPGAGGVIGQIVAFWHDAADREVVLSVSRQCARAVCLCLRRDVLMKDSAGRIQNAVSAAPSVEFNPAHAQLRMMRNLKTSLRLSLVSALLGCASCQTSIYEGGDDYLTLGFVDPLAASQPNDVYLILAVPKPGDSTECLPLRSSPALLTPADYETLLEYLRPELCAVYQQDAASYAATAEGVETSPGYRDRTVWVYLSYGILQDVPRREGCSVYLPRTGNGEPTTNMLEAFRTFDRERCSL